MPATPRPWAFLREDGPQACLLRVQAQPGARQGAILGRHGDALRVRVAAPPVDGKANEALCRWLADELGLPRRDVVVQQGPASRHKRVRIALPATRVAQWLATVPALQGPSA